MSENITKLKEWHQLYEQGIITEQEFNNKKKELLGLGSSSLPIDLPQKNSSTETNKFESSKKADKNKYNSTTNRNYNSGNAQKISSINSNSIIFISLIIIGAGIFSFWFWNKSKADNVVLNSSIGIDSTEVVIGRANMINSPDSSAEIIVVEQDRKVKDEELNSSEEISFAEFFEKFKEAVNTKNKKKALELTNTEEFYTGGVETASEWLDWHFNESANNDERYPYILDELKKGVKKEILKFPDGQKYKVINGDGGGLYFTLKDGKWKFNGVIH